MINKLLYIFEHYTVFIGFLWAFWGIGNYALSSKLKLGFDDPILSAVMAITIGQAVFIVILQCLAINGALRGAWLIVILAGAGLLGILERRRACQLPFASLGSTQTWSTISKAEKYGLVLIAIFLMPTLLAPLSPPLPGDELLYHLPHAQQWAQSGGLGINEWLRYPWFPYNYNLLYAGALAVYDDVFTHLFNMLAGLLIAVITYRFGARHFSVAAGFVATIIWLQICRGDFGKTNVDMGMSLYIFTASISFYWWVQEPGNRRWLVVSAFLMGVAVGSKYQGLLFLPFFGLALLWIDRKPTSWLLVAVSFLIPCVYWYARNAIMTGDPFNPFGGKYFGFFDWNLADYKTQFEDLKRQAGWPHWLLWPAIITLFKPIYRKSLARKAATALCTYAFLIWLVTSHYPRYLMPVFPLMALLAAEHWCRMFSLLSAWLKAHISPIKIRAIESGTWILLFMAVALSSAAFGKKYWFRISTTQEARNVLLRKEIPGYPVLEYANQHPMGRIYLVGSLTDAIYYAPHPIWGDVFGPWRYSDILSDDPIKFANELLVRDFDAVIADEKTWLKLELHPAFQQYFTIEFQYGGVKLYRLRA